MHIAPLKLVKHLKRALLPVSLVALLGVGGVPLMMFPSVRLVENNETLPLKEHSEVLSAVNRLDAHRNLRLDQRTSTVGLALPTGPALHRTQHLAFSTPRGHRLPNGLLAPLTC